MPCQVLTAPYNIWTREEFDQWVGAATREHLAAESAGQVDIPPPTEDEIIWVMGRVVAEINLTIVPAGNA